MVRSVRLDGGWQTPHASAGPVTGAGGRSSIVGGSWRRQTSAPDRQILIRGPLPRPRRVVTCGLASRGALRVDLARGRGTWRAAPPPPAPPPLRPVAATVAPQPACRAACESLDSETSR